VRIAAHTSPPTGVSSSLRAIASLNPDDPFSTRTGVYREVGGVGRYGFLVQANLLPVERAVGMGRVMELSRFRTSSRGRVPGLVARQAKTSVCTGSAVLAAAGLARRLQGDLEQSRLWMGCASRRSIGSLKHDGAGSAPTASERVFKRKFTAV
jgi:hypothetical protein